MLLVKFINLFDDAIRRKKKELDFIGIFLNKKFRSIKKKI